MADLTQSTGGFNSDEYAFKDLKIVMAGRVVAGLFNIKYKTTRPVTYKKGRGGVNHARIKGSKDHSGEIGIYQSELEALIKSVQAIKGKNADPTDITFDIIVSYAPEFGAVVTTDSLIGCDITEFEKALSESSPVMEINLPIGIGKIKYNV